MSNTPNVVIFGDSLSDNGNLYDLTDGVLFDPVRNNLGGDLNRIADGLVYGDYLQQLGFFQTTYNYAVAGGEAVGSQSLLQLLAKSIDPSVFLVPASDETLQVDVNLSAQVERFLADTDGQPLSDFTAHIEIGGNDYDTLTVSSPNTAQQELDFQVAVVVNQILSTVEQLAQAGVGAVEVVSLPPLHLTPLFADFSDDYLTAWDYVYESHNEVLEAALAGLDYAGVSIEFIDVDPLFAAVADDQESFGFVAPADTTMQGEDNPGLDLYDADQIMFFNDAHISSAMHGVQAAYIDAIDEKSLFEGTENGDFALNRAAEGAVVFAGGGVDFALTDAGDDIVFAGSGDDIVVTGGGDDLASGGSGADQIFSGAGDDIIDGDSGDDLIIAGDGNDAIVDGLGSDVVLGGAGDDAFIFTQADLIGGSAGDSDVFVGGAGTDTLYLVVDVATALQFGGFVSAAELSSLGVSAFGIENIVVVPGRDNLDDMASQSWYAEADIWGLI